MYQLIKVVHASCAVISILGFAWRGYLKVSRDSVPPRFHFRVLPHMIDTVLLASAISLVFLSHQYPFVSPWITAKVVTLIIYIGLGILLMRLQAEKSIRSLVYGLAMLCGIYMITVAISKNPLPLTF